MRASAPTIIATPARMRAAMKLVTDAQDQLQNGDVVGAKAKRRRSDYCELNRVYGCE
jgi:hypothetical protein